MVDRVYTDFSVTAATYFLKFTGAYFTESDADEIRRKIGLLHTGLVILSGVYVNSVNVKHFWGHDLSIFIVGTVAAAYVCPDTYMIIFNLHMICHFRLLQKQILDFWQRKKEDIDDDMTLARYTLNFKKCIVRHQLLITFCEKMERVFSLTIFMHFLVFSAYIGLDGYEILLPTTALERRMTIVFLVGGSFGHLGVLSYSCDYIIEESTNIITTIYRGSWATMPMNQMGRILRLDMRMVMMKGLRPCCLTAAGFFPVSLETFTKFLPKAACHSLGDQKSKRTMARTIVYRVFGLRAATFMWKISGVYFPEKKTDEIKSILSLFVLSYTSCYGFYVNSVTIKHLWGSDMSYCSFCFCNFLMVFLALSRVVVLRLRRFHFKDLIVFSERYIWNDDYTPEEQAYIDIYHKLSGWWVIYGVTVTTICIIGYGAVPLMVNYREENQSHRELVFKMWVSWPVYDTPYYELMFCFQIFVVICTSIAYITPDAYMIIFNLHVICQFRILQKRILDFWQPKREDTDEDMTLLRYTVALKNCIQRHQLIITFCEKVERLFSPVILTHFLVFSAFMALDGYEMLLPTTSFERRATLFAHAVGSFLHVAVLSYSCDGIMEESANVIQAIYRGSWATMPMSQMGKMLRLDMRMVMMKGLRPCCLTAGGFFPVSLETFTTLASSTFSYFALMRESLAYDNSD
nr:PREDICTED: uncharacterized protein LOC100876729 [Megachile rotundata]